MSYQVARAMDAYFHFEKANVDKGLLRIEDKEKHALVKAYFDYSFVIDKDYGREVEIVNLRHQKCVVLPKSVRNRSKIIHVGVEPIFASLDPHNNLITYMFVGSLIRVEYLGQIGKSKKVKYFRCW